jgi:hypothetical protein
MLSLDLVKRKNKIVLIATIIILISSNLLFPTTVNAETITPFSTEDTLSIGNTSRHTLTLYNDNIYPIFVTPKIYKYYPQSEYITEPSTHEEIVRIDTDYIEIPNNTEKDISFEIIAPEALNPGTYYNLIVFQHSSQTESENPVIGASGELSHLVKLNLSNDPNLEKITDDYSVELSVIDRGIPFIKPAKLKLTFFNNSKYTLIPKGEIQVVKKSGNKEPEYIKINLDRVPVYPEDTLEKTYEVKNWYLEDILFGKYVYLKIENGIDESVRTQESTIPGFRNELLYILATLTVIILLATSLKSDTKPEQEYAE